MRCVELVAIVALTTACSGQRRGNRPAAVAGAAVAVDAIVRHDAATVIDASGPDLAQLGKLPPFPPALPSGHTSVPPEDAFKALDYNDGFTDVFRRRSKRCKPIRLASKRVTPSHAR